jgi:hypothetical protein
LSEQPKRSFADSLRVFLDIARLRRGPEDVPADRGLLLTTMAGYALISLAFALVPDQQQGEHPLLLLVLDAALMMGWVWLMLRAAGKPERFLQTMTAIFGFQMIASLPLGMALLLYLKFHENQAWQLAVSLPILALGIWALTVSARILSSATSWPVLGCIGLVLLQAILTRGILILLFPVPAAAGAAAG